jgi:hypothetical protein
VWSTAVAACGFSSDLELRMELMALVGGQAQVGMADGEELAC